MKAYRPRQALIAIVKSAAYEIANHGQEFVEILTLGRHFRLVAGRHQHVVILFDLKQELFLHVGIVRCKTSSGKSEHRQGIAFEELLHSTKRGLGGPSPGEIGFLCGPGGLPLAADSGNMKCMSNLMDIERAAVKLSAEEQQQLLRFLLRVVPVADGGLPPPRQFTEEEIQGWLAEDEASMRRFREGK